MYHMYIFTWNYCDPFRKLWPFWLWDKCLHGTKLLLFIFLSFSFFLFFFFFFFFVVAVLPLPVHEGRWMDGFEKVNSAYDNDRIQ